MSDLPPSSSPAPAADSDAPTATEAKAPARDSSRGLWGWAFAQLWIFIAFIGKMVIVGAVIEMVRRRFSYKACAAGAATMLVGVPIATMVTSGGSTVQLREAREWIFWVACFSVMAVAGWVTARVGRRLGFWEIYVATLVTLVVLGIELGKGWDVILGFGPGEQEVYLEFLTHMAPGERLLGPMWSRLLGLAAIGGFLVAVFSASVAYLFYGEEGRARFSFETEWVIAKRHLSGVGGAVSVTAVVAVIGIALGVAALITVTAVMSGYQQDVQDKILSTNAHLVVQKYGVDFVEYDDIIKRAQTVEGVLDASPFSFNEAMLSDGDLGLGVLLKGIVPTSAGKVTAIEANLCSAVDANGHCTAAEPAAGGLAGMLTRSASDLPRLVVGIGLYKKLGQPLGTRVTLTTPVGIAGARGNAPKRQDFELGGVFRSGMHEFDSRLVYLELESAQAFMGMGSAVHGVEFRVDEPQNVDLLSKRVLSAIGRYPYRTLDWRELNAGIFTALRLQKIVMFLILCFIVVVAAFNIASTLFMAVVERSREIGVLKSMGARDSSIMKIFVLEGWVVGGAGTLLGVLFGTLMCWGLSKLHIGIAADVYMVDSLEVLLRPAEMSMTIVAALCISHLATLHPALKAARQAPVDAMRHG